MKQFILIAILLIVTLISLTALAGNRFFAKTELSIDSTKWKLNTIVSEKNQINATDMKSYIHFDSAGGRISGNGGCNNFGGSYIIAENSIKFAQIFSTKMFCQQSQQIEDAYFNALQKVNRYEIVNDRLEMFRDNVLLLTFSKLQ